MIEKIEKLRGLVKRKMQDYVSGHDYLHVQRVVNIAKKLAKAQEKKGEKVDWHALESAILLHALGYFVFPKDKRKALKESVRLARKMLKDANYEEGEISKICDIIEDHRFSPKSIEEKILHDSEIIDSIGAIGIARVFERSGDIKQPMYVLGNEKSPEGGFGYILNVLAKEADELILEDSKKMAKRRQKFLNSFIVNMEREIKETIH